MKLPSITALVQGALATFLRFPFVLVVAVIGTAVAISHPDDPRFILTCILGIPLLVAIAVFGERRGWGMAGRTVGALAGILLLAGYYLTMAPERPSEVDQIRFLVLAVVLHLLVAIAPYLVRNQLGGFWQYNKSLFLRALATALYTGVLYAGLALALLALEELFGIDLGNDAPADLGIILLGIFNTLFFLAGVPRDFDGLEQDRSYPGGLKVFTQYVLLPLVAIYLVILYLYAGKIVLEWSWPNGWVSSLILGFSVAGILSSLLLYPIRNLEGNTWISRFYAGFYYAVLPLTVLLFLAIWRRVSDYGITEGRYYALALAVWLGGISVYMLVTRGRNIRAIPLSLAVLGLLSAFGPWGAFQVSVDSQVAQLKGLLEEEKVMDNGVVARKLAAPQSDAAARISSIGYYLLSRDALGEIAPLLGVGGDTIELNDLFARIGTTDETYESARHFSAIDSDVLDIAGYERLVRYGRYGSDDPVRVELGGDTLVISFEDTTSTLLVHRGGERLLAIAMREPALRLGRLYPTGTRATPLPREMVLQGSAGGINVRLQLLSLATSRIGTGDAPLDVDITDAWVMLGRGEAAEQGAPPEGTPSGGTSVPPVPALDTPRVEMRSN